jgi:hypothetical protein
MIARMWRRPARPVKMKTTLRSDSTASTIFTHKEEAEGGAFQYSASHILAAKMIALKMFTQMHHLLNSS